MRLKTSTPQNILLEYWYQVLLFYGLLLRLLQFRMNFMLKYAEKFILLLVNRHSLIKLKKLNRFMFLIDVYLIEAINLVF